MPSSLHHINAVLVKNIYLGCPLVVHSDPVPLHSRPCIFVRAFVMECLVRSSSNKATSVQCRNLMDILSLRTTTRFPNALTHTRCSDSLLSGESRSHCYFHSSRRQKETIIHLPCQKDSLAGWVKIIYLLLWCRAAFIEINLAHLTWIGHLINLKNIENQCVTGTAVSSLETFKSWKAGEMEAGSLLAQDSGCLLGARWHFNWVL